MELMQDLYTVLEILVVCFLAYIAHRLLKWIRSDK